MPPPARGPPPRRVRRRGPRAPRRHLGLAHPGKLERTVGELWLQISGRALRLLRVRAQADHLRRRAFALGESLASQWGRSFPSDANSFRGYRAGPLPLKTPMVDPRTAAAAPYCSERPTEHSGSFARSTRELPRSSFGIAMQETWRMASPQPLGTTTGSPAELRADAWFPCLRHGVAERSDRGRSNRVASRCQHHRLAPDGTASRLALWVIATAQQHAPASRAKGAAHHSRVGSKR